MSSGKSKLGKFGQLPAADQWLVVRAAFWLGIARIRLVITPFRRLSEGLARDSDVSCNEVDPKYVERVGYAVRAAANSVPWRSDCFPQAVAARTLLSGKGYNTVIHLGVEKDGEGDLAGHAWLTCGETVVTGGGDLDRYTEMYHINA
jgi:hypothetical protein